MTHMVLHGGGLALPRTLVFSRADQPSMSSHFLVILILHHRYFRCRFTTVIFFVTVLPSWIVRTVSVHALRLATSCRRINCRHFDCAALRNQLMSRRSLHRDCSTIVSPWLLRNNAANASVVPLPFRFVMLSVARFTLVVRRFLPFNMITVAPFQTLE